MSVKVGNYKMCKTPCWCRFCGKKILEGVSYWEFYGINGRFPQRHNVCPKCCFDFGKELLEKFTEEVSFEKELANLSHKERKLKVKMLMEIQK